VTFGLRPTQLVGLVDIEGRNTGLVEEFLKRCPGGGWRVDALPSGNGADGGTDEG
jgi:hypothetical protein